ncbi:uncharacterized protein LOC131948815 isoform X2 [Physella acuta]|uniref:uncharacterized protein LOC131948815 isoform X2 n=1 Tax=Physella acuta TaxID=109671 RepID=UPI0027DB6F5B|nr:uncharacterized protein LOC131948815 isoform X2 [Physella acuta]
MQLMDDRKRRKQKELFRNDAAIRGNRKLNFTYLFYNSNEKAENSSSGSQTASPYVLHTTVNYVTLDQLQNVLQKIETADIKTDSLEKKYQKLEEDFKTLSEQQKNVEVKRKSQMKISKNHERRIDELEENIKILTEKIEVQTELITTQSDKAKQIKASIKEVNEIINCNQKLIHETKENLQKLSKKLNDSESLVKEMSEKQSKFSSQLENFDHKNVEMKMKFGAMCQVLAKRYHILDSVKQFVNKLSLTRDEAYLKLNDKITTLEEMITTSSLGFAAEVGVEDRNQYLSRVLFNNGDHFDPNTGEFTAPTEGVYCVSLMIFSDCDTDDAVQIILRVQDEPTNEHNDEIIDQISSGSIGSLMDKEAPNETDSQRLNIVKGFSSFVANVHLLCGSKVLLRLILNAKKRKTDFYLLFCCYKIKEVFNLKDN